MVEAILWMAGLSLLALFLMIPMSVHLLREALGTDEDETAVGPQARRETRASAPQQGNTGT